MRVHLAAALLASAATAAPALAEFQLAPGPQAAAGAEAAEQTEPRPLARLHPAFPAQAGRRAAGVSAPVAAGGVPLAQGFGKQVPLSFATRQIVPAKVKVTFGPDVDQEAPVDWTGGRRWDGALRAAVRPLGLRVVVGWMAVSITRS